MVSKAKPDQAPQDGGFNADSFGAIPEQEWENDEFELDLESADENARPDLLPPGIHDGRIDSAEFGFSNANNPMITLRIKFPREDGPGELTLMHFLLLTPQQMGRTKKFMKTIAPDVDLSHFRPNDADNYLAGREVSAKIRTKMYEGQRRNNITQIMPPRSYTGDEFLANAR